jgi:WD40 repeat protein/DNA-binding SARP family transcriptional activator
VGISVLGPLQLDGNGTELGRRDRVVLAALAIRPGDGVSTAQLADALWGEHPPRSWTKLVQGCVMRLRKTLGNHAIETTPAGYRLMLGSQETDAQRFEYDVRRAREQLARAEFDRAAAVLAGALAMWHGAPFAELDEWAPAKIEAGRLEELRRSAGELHLEASLGAGRHADVISEARRLVAEAPLRERRWLLLATAQYRDGRQAEALSTLRRVRALLRDELAIDPGPDIVALEAGILRQDPTLLVEARQVSESYSCPYQGLRPYDVGDADIFYGRDQDVAEGVRRLTDTGVLAVVGPSGGGKSSLVRAGLAAPLLRKGDRVVVITPGAHPVESLRALPGRGQVPMLVVDQCEEVFTLCTGTEEREQFLAALVAHANVAPLVLALRADRLTDVASHAAFARIVQSGFYLLPSMDEGDLRDAIEQPAAMAGLTLEAGLVDLLVGEIAGRAGALPMLSHALAETWQRREGRTLTVAGYRASGGIAGAIAQTAELLYQELSQGRRDVLRELLQRLVTLGPNDEPSRGRVVQRLVVTDSDRVAVLELLTRARLVTVDDETVEIAHEALLSAWPRLRDWLQQDVEGQRLMHHVAAAAGAWDALGRPESELYRGVRLVSALEWRDRAAPNLLGHERDFLAASRRLDELDLRHAEERSRQEARTNRRLRGLLAAAVLLLIGALVTGFFAVAQADRAGQEAQRADKQRQAADASRAGSAALVEEDIDASLLRAAAAASLAAGSESRANLLAALDQRRQLVRSVTMPPGAVTGIDVRPDGRAVGVYGANSAVLLQDPHTGRVSAEHEPDPTVDALSNVPSGTLAFSPGGRDVAVAMPPLDPEPVRLLDAESLSPRNVRLPGFPRDPAQTLQIGYSANGRFLVASMYVYGDGPNASFTRGRIIVWDVRRPSRPTVALTQDVGGNIEGLAVGLSADGRRLYTSNPLAAYDVASGRRLWNRPKLTMHDLSVSPDGRLLSLTDALDPVSDSETDTVLLIDARTGQTTRSLSGHTGVVVSARFSHDGTRLASSAMDFRVNLWDVGTGEVVESLNLDSFSEISLAFSPDDKTLYTAAGDEMLRTWDLSGPSRYVRQLAAPKEFIFGCTYAAPGGRTVWQGGALGTRFIDVSSGSSTPWGPPGHEGSNDTCATWHPRGDRLVEVRHGALFVHDASDASLLARRRVAGDLVTDLDYSGDGSRIALAENNGRITLVDADTLTPVARHQLDEPARWISASPDNRRVFVVTGGRWLADGAFVTPADSWLLVDVLSGEVVRRGTLPFERSTQPWFSHDGQHVAIGSYDGEVLVIDVDTGNAVSPAFDAHEGFVQYIAWTPDDSALASSGGDGSVSLMDGDTGQPLGAVLTPGRAMVGADFTSDGQSLVIASNNQGVYEWDTRVSAAVAAACQMAGRDLSREEWKVSFSGSTYRRTCA